MSPTDTDVEKTARQLFEEEAGRPWEVACGPRGPSSASPLPAATEAEKESYRQRARENLDAGGSR
ncbi:hypothetical protein [Komagataeibacter sp. FNDCF1]|uniref:hypothetical protein n=1 Tax=Komagataeibacter sp. FNDCF1 TaxID=2878681 RepID=UPI001E3EE692|nr:hypothetical protein [Komagataeibacter sp. FNDCF1]MCE2563551.1 hypothetical protein [Komagataeibacter sp. FNDCF1]